MNNLIINLILKSGAPQWLAGYSPIAIKFLIAIYLVYFVYSIIKIKQKSWRKTTEFVRDALWRAYKKSTDRISEIAQKRHSQLYPCKAGERECEHLDSNLMIQLHFANLYLREVITVDATAIVERSFREEKLLIKSDADLKEFCKSSAEIVLSNNRHKLDDLGFNDLNLVKNTDEQRFSSYEAAEMYHEAALYFKQQRKQEMAEILSMINPLKMIFSILKGSL